MKGKKRAGGGPVRAGGNPKVFEEAERKRGGRVKLATGGKVAGVAAEAAPKTKTVGLMTGGGVRPRLDRPGRKVGGRVGANTSPLSTAHGTTSPSSTPRSQEGGAS